VYIYIYPSVEFYSQSFSISHALQCPCGDNLNLKRVSQFIQLTNLFTLARVQQQTTAFNMSLQVNSASKCPYTNIYVSGDFPVVTWFLYGIYNNKNNQEFCET